MTKRTWISMAVALGLLVAVFPSTSLAQEIQITGPLAGAPAVRRMRVYREGRVQLAPFVGFTLQDEFSRTIALGATATYHFTDWFGIGLWGFGGISVDTALTDEVVSKGQTNSRNRLSLPSASGFRNQIARMNWGVAAQAVFIPLRGKLSLFQKLFIDADFFVTAGFAMIGVSERTEFSGSGTCLPNDAGGTDNPACLASQTTSGRIAPAPTFSAGLSLHVNDWAALNIEWRGIPFAWNTSGTDEYGVEANGSSNFPDGRIDANDRRFVFNHMFILGFTFYLPTSATIGE